MTRCLFRLRQDGPHTSEEPPRIPFSITRNNFSAFSYFISCIDIFIAHWYVLPGKEVNYEGFIRWKVSQKNPWRSWGKTTAKKNTSHKHIKICFIFSCFKNKYLIYFNWANLCPVFCWCWVITLFLRSAKSSSSFFMDLNAS